MNKKIIITGITGLVGKALSQACLEAGFDVIGLSRNPVRAKNTLAPEVQLLDWKDVDTDYCRLYFEGAYAIINLAGENIGDHRWTADQKRRILHSRLNSVGKLHGILKSLKQKPKLFLQASAVGYYGYNTSVPVNETSTVGSGFLSSVCNQLEAEVHEITELRTVVMRFGVVLDSEEGALAKIVKPMKRFGVGAILLPGSNYLSWIHLSDLTHAILHILNLSDPKPVYNITSPNPIPYKKFYAQAASIQSTWIKIPVPVQMLQIPFGRKMVKETLQASQFVLPQALMDDGFVFRYPEIDNALQHLLT